MDDNDSSKDILALLDEYFAGLYAGDTGRLRALFHPQAALFANLGQPYHKTIDAYLEGVAQRRSPKDAGEAFRMRLVALDVTHNIAMAKVYVPALGFNYYN